MIWADYQDEDEHAVNEHDPATSTLRYYLSVKSLRLEAKWWPGTMLISGTEPSFTKVFVDSAGDGFLVGCTLGGFKKPKVSQTTFPFWYVLGLWYLRSLPKNWTNPTKIECPQPLFSFWPFKRVKQLQNASKNMIFKNWLDSRPKMLNAWSRCLIKHFGGCFARFLDSAKVPVFKCQKMALRAPKSKNGLQKPCETPPQMVC